MTTWRDVGLRIEDMRAVYIKTLTMTDEQWARYALAILTELRSRMEPAAALAAISAHIATSKFPPTISDLLDATHDAAQPVERDVWEARAQIAMTAIINGTTIDTWWPVKWGPRPGHDACKCPRDLQDRILSAENPATPGQIPGARRPQ